MNTFLIELQRMTPCGRRREGEILFDRGTPDIRALHRKSRSALNPDPPVSSVFPRVVYGGHLPPPKSEMPLAKFETLNENFEMPPPKYVYNILVYNIILLPNIFK